MPSVYIDTYQLVCPHPDEGRDVVMAYVNKLLAWQELRHQDAVTVYLSSTAYDILAETSTYPVWDHIANAVSYLGILDIGPQDVQEIVRQILTKTPMIEDTLRLSELVADVKTCHPIEFFQDRPSRFIEHSKQLIARTRLANDMLGGETASHVFVTPGFPDADRVIAVSADLLCEFDEPVNHSIPTEVSGEVAATSCPTLCFGRFDPTDIWLSARSDDERLLSVLVSVLALAKSQKIVCDSSILNGFRFGPNFVMSAERNGFTTEPARVRALLRAISETILSLNMADVHELRRSKAGDSGQRIRGADLAWRRDVDRFYHLHYWQTQVGLEVANLVVHDDMAIT